ncbi:hypothetical protein C8255_20535 [filamentous cyanobacterium CCP3]|nr:hypothetical protein C8255_20535 [filamentous cyanobacterium CCP3]
MTRQATVAAPQPITHPLSQGGILQRKCSSCGQHKTGGGTCAKCQGNRSKTSAPALPMIQTKLTVGAPNDKYEQEADRVADQIMRMPAPQSDVAMRSQRPRIQRKCAQCDDEQRLQMKQTPGGTPEVTPAIASHIQSLQGRGRPLPTSTRNYFEPRFGQDFSHVRVHTDESAKALGARAYTVGRNIVFGNGQYKPDIMSGRQLIAHELAHVLQQTESRPAGMTPVMGSMVQRQQEDGASSSEALTPGPATATSETEVRAQTPPAPLTEIRPSEEDRVRRIVISCSNMRLRIETATTVHTYRLEECALPLGSYDPTVTIGTITDSGEIIASETGNDFFLHFGAAVQADEEFSFRYRVDPGQENPTDFLRGQTSVHVDVVDDLPASREESTPEERQRRTPECVVRLEDRELVPADSFRRRLFEPKQVRNMTIWQHEIPLGQFGWVEVAAQVSAGLEGNFSADYGPGRLTDICLTHLIDRESASAPIEHPLLGRGSRTDVTTYGIGGRARFRLPARTIVRISGSGGIRISGEYLSAIDLAAAEANLTASGTATLAGEINGSVEIVAQATHSAATLEDNLLPVSVTIENSTIDDVDLAAEIGLRGRAALMFRVDLSAGFDLLGFNLWRQTWNLAQFDAGVAWQGGLKYSPNPGLHFDLGTLGINDEEALATGEDEGLEDIAFNEDSAVIDEEDIIEAILDEEDAQVSTPDGLSEEKALPFDWYKPIELYPEVIHLPAADDPQEVRRDNGPTGVRYRDYRGRTITEYIGVADWPAQRKKFEYMPYDERREPEKNRFNSLLDRLGFSRAGLDGDHVWDIKLRGLEYDRFDNLWPASNQDQRLSGTRHDIQIRNYERTLGNINGRWFVISRVLPPY